MLAKITILLLVIFLLAVIFRFSVPFLSATSVASGPVPGSTQDQAASITLGDCPTTPNCQASVATRENQRCDPLPFSVPANEVIEKTRIYLQAWTETSERWSVETQTADYLHLTAKSKVMGFIDDVEFLVNHNTLTLEIRSASRLGKSDLGANKRRIDQIRTALRAVLTP